MSNQYSITPLPRLLAKADMLMQKVEKMEANNKEDTDEFKDTCIDIVFILQEIRRRERGKV